MMTVVLNCWNVYKNHDVQVTIKALGPLVYILFQYTCKSVFAHIFGSIYSILFDRNFCTMYILWLGNKILILTFFKLNISWLTFLGMDDGKDDADAATVQGAYLSFLHLRHLRLRDMHRTVWIRQIEGENVYLRIEKN